MLDENIHAAISNLFAVPSTVESFLFVGSQICPGLWVRNFVGRNVGMILVNIIQILVYVRGYVNLWARVTHETNEHWSPTNN